MKLALYYANNKPRTKKLGFRKVKAIAWRKIFAGTKFCEFHIFFHKSENLRSVKLNSERTMGKF